MFVGRVDEVESLETALIQTTADSPTHFMITGERGIGKTSLLLYVKFLAKGAIPLDNGTKFNFLIIDLDIDANSTQRGLIQRIASRLESELGQSEPAREFFKKAWAFLQRLRIMDSGIEATTLNSPPDELLLDQFAASLAETTARICTLDPTSSSCATQHDGILILIDEADNSSAELGLGSFLKLLLERLQRSSCNRVLIGLAGLPDLRTKLYASHPSSVRIFQELPLDRLPHDEISRVIDLCIHRANQHNTDKLTITPDAKQALASLSEGFPHFIQQFGFSAFARDTDNILDINDVNVSAFGRGGALEIIGDRYYRHDFYNKIQKESYRQVLRIMADDLDSWVPRSKIREKFKGNNGTLNNAIKALRDRHIILSKEGEKGIYRLQHKGFALWIKLHTGTEATASKSTATNPQSGTAPSQGTQSS